MWNSISGILHCEFLHWWSPQPVTYLGQLWGFSHFTSPLRFWADQQVVEINKPLHHPQLWPCLKHELLYWSWQSIQILMDWNNCIFCHYSPHCPHQLHDTGNPPSLMWMYSGHVPLEIGSHALAAGWFRFLPVFTHQTFHVTTECAVSWPITRSNQ